MTDRADLPARLRANAIGYTSVGVHDTAALLNEAADALSAIASRQAVVTDEMVEAALHGRVPGGSEVWVWIAQDDAFKPSETARDVIRAALNSALAAPVRDETRAAADDTARLDFLDRCNATLNAKYGTNYRWKLILNHNVNRLMLDHMAVDLNDMEANGLPSCRDAIDVAIRALSQTSKPEGETR